VLEAQGSGASALSIHGYLTQAYGFTSHDTFMGLTPQGTTDYPRAAVVARYAPTALHAFVVQLGHRRLGDSPTMKFEDTVKLDMAFYEHRFAFGTTLRAGKSVLPGGTCSEVRYVGALLPFFRAPLSVYSEGSYVSETINGVVLSHRLRAGEPWELSSDLYAGDFGLLEFGPVFSPTGPPTYQGARMQSKNVLGGQFWLTTPIEGLRIGAGGRRKDDYGGVNAANRGAGRVVADVNGGVDAHFDRWQFRAETDRITAKYLNVKAEYAQLGVTPMSWLSVNVQREFVEVHVATPPAPMLRVKFDRDDAIGVNFMLDSRTTLKFEQHRSLGFNYEQVVNPFGPRIKGSYFITSISTSF